MTSFCLSLLIHSGLYGTWAVGKQLGWWEHQATWLIRWQSAKIKSALEAAAARQRKEYEQKLKKIPLTFVEVDASVAVEEPLSETPYYGTHNTVAANPDPTSRNLPVPKIEGSQDKMIRLADNPRPKPFPLQPALPPEEVEPEKKTEPEETQTPQQVADAKASLEPGQSLRVGTPPPPAPKRTRPRTLAQAAAQEPTLAGEKTRQEGGVRRRGRVSLDVKASPFGAYDLAFIRAVEKRWYDLLDNTSFVQRSGKVVLDFKLHADGTITTVQVLGNEVGEILGLLCQRAILDPAPYAPWPSDMRRMVGASYREVTFTFYYN